MDDFKREISVKLSGLLLFMINNQIKSQAAAKHQAIEIIVKEIGSLMRPFNGCMEPEQFYTNFLSLFEAPTTELSENNMLFFLISQTLSKINQQRKTDTTFTLIRTLMETMTRAVEGDNSEIFEIGSMKITMDQKEDVLIPIMEGILIGLVYLEQRNDEQFIQDLVGWVRNQVQNTKFYQMISNTAQMEVSVDRNALQRLDAQIKRRFEHTQGDSSALIEEAKKKEYPRLFRKRMTTLWAKILKTSLDHLLSGSDVEDLPLKLKGVFHSELLGLVQGGEEFLDTVCSASSFCTESLQPYFEYALFKSDNDSYDSISEIDSGNFWARVALYIWDEQAAWDKLMQYLIIYWDQSINREFSEYAKDQSNQLLPEQPSWATGDLVDRIYSTEEYSMGMFINPETISEIVSQLQTLLPIVRDPLNVSTEMVMQMVERFGVYLLSSYLSSAGLPSTLSSLQVGSLIEALTARDIQRVKELIVRWLDTMLEEVITTTNPNLKYLAEVTRTVKSIALEYIFKGEEYDKNKLIRQILALLDRLPDNVPSVRISAGIGGSIVWQDQRVFGTSITPFAEGPFVPLIVTDQLMWRTNFSGNGLTPFYFYIAENNMIGSFVSYLTADEENPNNYLLDFRFTFGLLTCVHGNAKSELEEVKPDVFQWRLGVGMHVFQMGIPDETLSYKERLSFGPHLETAIRINFNNGFGAIELGGFAGMHWTVADRVNKRFNYGGFISVDAFDLVTLFDLIVGDGS